jgi:hypothetical protein
VVGLYVPAFFEAKKIASKKSSTAIPNAKEQLVRIGINHSCALRYIPFVTLEASQRTRAT